MSCRRLQQNFSQRRKREGDENVPDFQSSAPKRPCEDNPDSNIRNFADENQPLFSSDNDFENFLEADDLDSLYYGSRLSKFDFCMALTLIARKAQLSDSALEKILQLFNITLPADNKCPQTVRTFKNYLSGKAPVYGKPQEIKFCTKCGNTVDKCQCRKKETNTALIQKFNIADQITSVLEKYPNIRSKYSSFINQHENTVYLDALSGSARKAHAGDVIGLAMYADGIKVSKSSSEELWILGATILDFPMRIRFSQKNFIFLAAWYSSSKPVWPFISEHVNQELGRLITVGNIELPLAVLQVNADIPARASLLNCMQSGYCPCLRCNIRGEYSNKLMQYSTFDNVKTTSGSYISEVEKALNNTTNSTIACPKGYCSFDQLHIPECVTSDIMHTVYLGPLRDDIVEIAKNKIIFELFNSVIQEIKWPEELSQRKLRPLSEMNLFKASEWKTIILYLTTPLLNIALHTFTLQSALKNQMINILKGISAILILMKDQVCERDIIESKDRLKLWFNERKEIFSHNPYTLKVHEFTHLPDQVRIHGPLQGSSCFAGENVLNRISKMITCRTGKVLLKQVAERSDQELQIAKWKTMQNDSMLKEFIKIIDQKNHTSSIVDLPQETVIATTLNINNGLKSTEIEGYEYSASEIVENMKNSYCCFIHERRFKVGIIEYISTVNDETFLQIQPLENEQINDVYCTGPKVQNYFIVGEKLGIPLILKSSDIKTKGFVFKSHEKSFFVPLAHVFEHN